MVTAIQLRPETRARLDDAKMHPKETYDKTYQPPRPEAPGSPCLYEDDKNI